MRQGYASEKQKSFFEVLGNFSQPVFKMGWNLANRGNIGTQALLKPH